MDYHLKILRGLFPKLKIVLDLAQHPTLDNTNCDYSVYSFVQNKIINTGEGGLVASQTSLKDMTEFTLLSLKDLQIP